MVTYLSDAMVAETIDQLERMKEQLLRLLKDANKLSAFDALRSEQFNFDMIEIRHQSEKLSARIQRWLIESDMDRRIGHDRRVIKERRFRNGPNTKPS